jgi:uncharacterized protein (TIRG00374 family)
VIRALTRPRPLARFRAGLEEVHRGVSSIVGSRRVALPVVLSLVAWSIECAGVALVITRLPGSDISITGGLALYPVALLAGTLSLLPGGLGLTEATLAVLLVQAPGGLEVPAATAGALLIRFATFWFSVALGFVALTIARRR